MRKSEKAAVMIIVQINGAAFLWGGPGQGKSSFIRNGFEKLGYRVKIIRVNTILPHHLSGSPIPSSDGKSVVYVPPSWALELNEAPKSVLFLDDVSCASTMGQTACLGLMDEREVGGVKLKAIPIAAANPNTLATARFELDAAAANRCIHVTITSDGETFRDDAMNGFPAPVVPTIRESWEKLIPRKVDLVTKFLASPEGASVLNAMPDQITMKSVAWPSERTWEWFWKIQAACDCIDLESIPGIDLRQVRSILCCGAVGEGAYNTFLKYFTKPMEAKVDSALRQNKKYRFPETGDEMFGLLEAVAAKLTGGFTPETWGQAWGIVEGAYETAHRDRIVPFVLDMLSINKGQFNPPAFYDKTVRKFLEAAA